MNDDAASAAWRMTVSASIRNALVIGVTFLLGLALATWWHRQSTQPPTISSTSPTLPTSSDPPIPITDEERPPIIVSGGSVNLWDVYKPSSANKGRGTWYDVNGDAETWELRYGLGWKPVEYLQLNLVNLELVGGKECKTYSQVHDVDLFQLDMNHDSKLTMKVVGGNPHVIFSGDYKKGKKENNLDFFLTVEAKGLRNLKLNRIYFKDRAGTTEVDCKFKDHSPVISINQIPPSMVKAK